MNNNSKDRPKARGMSIAAFGERYGLGRTTTYQEIKAGRLKAHKCGTRTIITEDDAEDWLRSLPILALSGSTDAADAASRGDNVTITDKFTKIKITAAVSAKHADQHQSQKTRGQIAKQRGGA